MTLFAVSYLNFFDNELMTTFVRASDWRSAVSSWEKIGPEFVEGFEIEDLDEAKRYAFDQDFIFEVKEVPN